MMFLFKDNKKWIILNIKNNSNSRAMKMKKWFVMQPINCLRQPMMYQAFVPSEYSKCPLNSYIFNLCYILYYFEANVCKLFTTLMKMGLKWCVQTYQDMLAWL